jgi:hypothetical protein
MSHHHHHAEVERPTDPGEGDPLGDLKECAEHYEKLEFCLANTKRDWTKCQDAVKKVKECIQAQVIRNREK